ncbi:MAG: putative protease [Limisphaerales bacterium]|nr:MAG: putative protease [Limisphaerales bacterium]KAG0508581.1 MAG: putative protease [Limisphaerales bacterium]TXT48022.1 MAG: putative protease [Limisphaerales bacterium]
MSTAAQPVQGSTSETPVSPGAAPALPELLAPAGDWECAKAAVENGADAIYFGLDRFNARMRAHNFTEADLPRLMEFLHRRGVKGYVTFNTLVFADELAAAGEYLRSIIAAGVDAAIVQDVGIARLIRRLSPDFPIHASTQMTITSAAGVAFARALGCNLVVLARECSIREIAAIQEAQREGSSKFKVQSSTSCASESNLEPGTLNSELPLEVFVHGALCVAYSGQCLTSEALGGRSANRGECAQACRMPYELISDGRKVELGGRNYLLSPQDLAGHDVLPDLVRAGVASLKIEGRLKSPEYVASITRIYRQALDKLGSRRGEEADGGKGQNPPPPHLGGYERYELEMAFSRGLFTGWFGGVDNQQLVHARFGKKRGAFVGEVTRVAGDRVHVRLAGPLKAGDGIVFDPGHGLDDEEGGRVFQVQSSKFKVEAPEAVLTFMPGAVDFTRVHVGDKLWKTSDAELEKRVRATFAGDAPRFQRPLTLEVHGHAGTPLTLIARDELGHVAQVQSTAPLAAAEKQPLTTERLKEQLGRLGGTPFKLGDLRNQLEGAVIAPVSELNRLRREIAAELERQRALPKRWTLRGSEFGVSGLGLGAAGCDNSKLQTPNSELIVLVRTQAQLEAALRCDVTTIYCEFEDPKRYREAVTTFHTARDCRSPAGNRQPAIFVAPPRITKSGEERILKQVRSCDADGYLVRNYDHLSFFADCRRVGDFSLNVANPLTADYFMSRFGLERLTASYDLNISQLEALVRAAPPAWFEVTIHQHMPMFHMEHCVFCAFLSKGKDYHDCGRPCDHHDVRVRDRVGQEHPLKADAGCRNTVFNARAQTGAEFVGRLQTLGVRRFRIEFVNESPEEVATTIARYRALLRGELAGERLWRELKLHHQLGVTRGPMER